MHSLRAAKSNRALFLSATVYAHRLTELQIWNPQGELRAVSNVDFNILAGLTEIETPDTVWLLLLSVGNKPREADAAAAHPLLKRLSPSRAQYALVAAPAPPDDATLSALDAIHTYVEAHHERLLAEHAQREASRAAAALSPTAPPAIPKATIIRYWPQKSRVYPNTPR